MKQDEIVQAITHDESGVGDEFDDDCADYDEDDEFVADEDDD